MKENERYRVSFIGNHFAITIEGDGSVDLQVPRGLSADEMAFLTAMTDLLARLRNGHLISYEPALISNENPHELLKCQWKKSGILKLVGPTEIVYQFCETVEEALLKSRVFTCKRSLFGKLPLRRQNIPLET